MNIFVLDLDPVKASEMLDSPRKCKMILESAQMIENIYENKIYKRTHYNHPCNVWLRESTGNVLWLMRYFVALSDRYKRDFGKVYLSRSKLTYIDSEIVRLSSDHQEMTPFKNCTTFKEVSDIILAYNLYLKSKNPNYEYNSKSDI